MVRGNVFGWWATIGLSNLTRGPEQKQTDGRFGDQPYRKNMEKNVIFEKMNI